VRLGRPIPEEFDLELGSGRLRVRRFGSRQGTPILCLPGLAANAACFDFIAERLAGQRRQVIAVDLRGRGRRQVTPAGTYGWPSHARDVLELAARLDFDRVTLVGHSMGAFVAMQVVQMGPDSVERVILLDGAGLPEAGAAADLATRNGRPGSVYSSAEEYLSSVGTTIAPWNQYWRRYFLYDLLPHGDGVMARLDRDAVLEDIAYSGIHDPADLWPHLTMPVLLVRARRPIGAGHVVSESAASEFRERLPHAWIEEVDADHFGVLMHGGTVAAMKRFLATRTKESSGGLRRARPHVAGSPRTPHRT
jgi:pimeloyl-ACP methyl ester carboxylesterase